MQTESEVGNDRLQVCLSRLNQTMASKMYIRRFSQIHFVWEGLENRRCVWEVWKIRVACLVPIKAGLRYFLLSPCWASNKLFFPQLSDILVGGWVEIWKSVGAFLLLFNSAALESPLGCWYCWPIPGVTGEQPFCEVRACSNSWIKRRGGCTLTEWDDSVQISLVGSCLRPCGSRYRK